MKKKISILGSTGSIGSTTLKIIDKKRFLFNIILLSAKNNYGLICRQIYRYKPKYFVISNPSVFKKVKKKFKNKPTVILDDYKKIKFKKKMDIVVSAIPGIDGLLPTLSILSCRKHLQTWMKEVAVGVNFSIVSCNI